MRLSSGSLLPEQGDVEATLGFKLRGDNRLVFDTA